MKTAQYLEDAIQKITEAKELIQQARTNQSLQDYYGYTLAQMEDNLDIIAENDKGFLSRQTNLREIIDFEGEKWNEE